MRNKIFKPIIFILLYIISFLIITIGTIPCICTGIGFIIGETIFLIKKLLNLIETKSKKTKTIIYAIFTIIFLPLFIWQFTVNTNEFTNLIEDTEKYTQFSTGTITQIDNNKLFIDTIVNKKEKKFIIDVENVEGYVIGNNIDVYFNPENIDKATVISPILTKMIYFTSYMIIIVPLFSLAFVSIKSLYRTFNPKKIKEEKEIKIKEYKNG